MKSIGDRVDAFCSYNRGDSDDVKFVVEQLAVRGGVKCFQDIAMQPGELWIQQLQEMLGLTEVFLFFVRTVPTQWQLRELSVAIELQLKTATGKPHIIPVLLPGALDEAYFNNPKLLFIRGSQAAQFSQSVKELDVIDTLARAIAGNSRVYISSRAIPRADKLPSGFQADLGRITELLIGESVYKSRDISVRELIQNARDACSRLLANQDLGLRSPEVIIRLDDKSRYFDVIDFGDGMSRNALTNSFAVLGKGLNDEFHTEKSFKQELALPITGKFGIGFISTFMIADRVAISTKANDDISHHLNILGAKLPFQYTDRSLCGRNSEENGTTVRVFLKTDYSIGSGRLDIRALARKFCRHVPGLFLADGKRKLRIESDWNYEEQKHGIVACIATESYEVRLSWASTHHDSIILSNGGFFVCPLDEIVLGDFPKGAVTGEINIAPGIIDLNVSRDAVIPNEKVARLRNIIGDVLTQLLRMSTDLLEKAAFGQGDGENWDTLAQCVRKSGVLIASLVNKGKLGEIRVDSGIDWKRVYWSALVVYLANIGSRNSEGRQTFQTLKRRLTQGSIAIVYAEQFSRVKHFSAGRICDGYIVLQTNVIAAQLPKRQTTLRESVFIGTLTPVAGAKLLSEEAAYDRFFGWSTPEGIRERLPRTAGTVIMAVLILLGLYMIFTWLAKLFS